MAGKKKREDIADYKAIISRQVRSPQSCRNLRISFSVKTSFPVSLSFEATSNPRISCRWAVEGSSRLALSRFRIVSSNLSNPARTRRRYFDGREKAHCAMVFVRIRNIAIGLDLGRDGLTDGRRASGTKSCSIVLVASKKFIDVTVPLSC